MRFGIPAVRIASESQVEMSSDVIGDLVCAVSNSEIIVILSINVDSLKDDHENVHRWLCEKWFLIIYDMICEKQYSA